MHYSNPNIHPYLPSLQPTWTKTFGRPMPRKNMPHGSFASLDELQRRVQFEAVATAGVLTCMLSFAWGMLEMAGLPKLPIVLVMPLFSAAYGFGVWRATRKYQ